MRQVSIFGSTGSIGSQALDVVRAHADKLEVRVLGACSNMEKLARQANAFRPPALVVASEDADISLLRRLLEYEPAIAQGARAMEGSLAAWRPDTALIAVSGLAALPLLCACLEEHIPVALSNKESIVAGADLFVDVWKRTGTPLYPVDSEHAAIYQCLGGSFDASRAARIWLTASGGPFLHWPKEDIASATPAQALAHPNWSMSRKISIDSATMANKGLEVIEAHFLFSMAPEAIRVIIQPKSLVHSMVEMVDSSVLAQMGPVDMRLPLQRALLPETPCEFTVNKPLDFEKVGTIEFVRPDFDRFPCLPLAYRAIARGQTGVYNAADDAAVGRYLGGAIRFGDIARIIADALDEFTGFHPQNFAQVFSLDAQVRSYVDNWVRERTQE